MTDSGADIQTILPPIPNKKDNLALETIYQKKANYCKKNTEIFFQQPSPEEDGFLHEGTPPSIPRPSFQTWWVQASPFLGLDDALVKQIATASLDDAMILAGGAEGRSDWRDQRQARGAGGGHIW